MCNAIHVAAHLAAAWYFATGASVEPEMMRGTRASSTSTESPSSTTAKLNLGPAPGSASSEHVTLYEHDCNTSERDLERELRHGTDSSKFASPCRLWWLAVPGPAGRQHPSGRSTGGPTRRQNTPRTAKTPVCQDHSKHQYVTHTKHHEKPPDIQSTQPGKPRWLTPPSNGFCSTCFTLRTLKSSWKAMK